MARSHRFPRSSRRATRRTTLALAELAALSALALVALALAPVLTAGGSAAAASGTAGAPLTAYGPTPPPATRPWVGVQPDWTTDTSASYVSSARSALSLIGRTFTYPLTPAGVHDLRDLSEQSVGVGAVAVVTLDPTSLTGLSDSSAAVLSSTLATISAQDGSRFLVRFGPRMNSGSVPWGAQPQAYVAAFRTVSTAVHQSTHHAAMVWSPAYGGSVSSRGGDPYVAYYPGDSAVDWVGLDVGVGGSLQADLREQAGYSTTPATSFYERFAAGRSKPLLLATGEGGGSWTTQALASAASHPLLRGILLDPAADAAVVGAVVNVRPATIAPVTTPRAPRSTAARSRTVADRRATDHRSRISYLAGLATAGAFGLVALLIALQIRRRRAVPDWLR